MKKIRLKSIIAIFLAILMILPLSLNLFNKNATAEDGSTDDNEVIDDTYVEHAIGYDPNLVDYGINTMDTGDYSDDANRPHFKVLDNAYSSRWQGVKAAFWYHSGDHSSSSTKRLDPSLSSNAYPSWGNWNGNIELFNTDIDGNELSFNMNTNWLALDDTDDSTNTYGYRAICMDPILPRWDNLTESSSIGDIIRIDEEATHSVNIPDEYKALRRLMWYSYFGGGGMYYDYLADAGNPYYTNSSKNLEGQVLGIDLSSGNTRPQSVDAQYVLLHMTASYIKDLSVAKFNSTDRTSYNYSDKYPALGNISGGQTDYGTTVTYKPALASSSNDKNNDDLADGSSGWNLAKVQSKGKVNEINQNAQDAVLKLYNLVSGGTGVTLDAGIPEGFVVYVGISNTTQKQSYVIYTIEDTPAIRILKQASISSANPGGATFGVYASEDEALSGERPLDVVTIYNRTSTVDGKTGYWSTRFTDKTRNAQKYRFDGKNNEITPSTYEYWVKEIGLPTETAPAGYQWQLNETPFKVTYQGKPWGTTANEKNIGFAAYTTITNELLKEKTGYFTFNKTSNVSKSYNGMVFGIYTDQECKHLVSKDLVPNQTITGGTVTDGKVTITNTTSHTKYTIGPIKVNLGFNESQWLYLKELYAPVISGGTWHTSSMTMCIRIIASENDTPSKPATSFYGTDFNNEFIPTNNEGAFKLQKVAQDTSNNTPNVLTGAQFTVYTDPNCKTKATAYIPNQTVTNCTVNNAVITLNASGTTRNGITTGQIKVELGQEASKTFYIKETKFPTNTLNSGSNWITDDPEVIAFTVKNDNIVVNVKYTNYSEENRYVGVFILHKDLYTYEGSKTGMMHYNFPSDPSLGIINQELSTGSRQTRYSLNDATFTAFFDTSGTISSMIPNSTMIVGKYTTLEDTLQGDTTDLSSFGTRSYEYYMTNGIYWVVNENKIDTSHYKTVNGFKIYTGNKIYVKETKLPTQLAKWDTSELNTYKEFEVVYMDYSTFSIIKNRLVMGQVGGGVVNYPTWEDLYGTIDRITGKYTNTWSNYVELPKMAHFSLSKKVQLMGGAPTTGPIGAQYTVYTDRLCRNIAYDIGNNGVLTITDQGRSGYSTGTVNVILGYASENPTLTYYIKETRIPTANPPAGYQWTMDSNVYTVRLGLPSSGLTTNVHITSTDRLVPLYGYFKINKIADIEDADLSGVVFTAYKDVACTQIVTDLVTVTDGKTITNGQIKIGAGNSSDLIRIKFDSTLNVFGRISGPGTFIMPIDGRIPGLTGDFTGGRANTVLGNSQERVIYLKETTYPNDSQLTNPIPGGDQGSWVHTNTVYKITISYEATATKPYTISISNTAKYPNVGMVQIGKRPEDTGDYTIDPMLVAGAKYGLYTDPACTRPMQLSNRMPATLTISATGTSPLLLIDLAYNTNITAYIKEISPPTHNPPGWEWQLSDEVIVVEINAISNLSNYAREVVRVTFEEPIEPAEGYVRIYKTVPALSATGAEYTVYNDARCTSIATDVGNRGVIAIGSTQDTSGGRQPYPYMSATTKVPLGTGTLSSDGYGRRIWIKETKAPRTAVVDGSWGLDSRVYSVLITPNNIISSPVIVTSADQLYYNFTLQKEVRGNYGHRYEKFQFGLVGQTATGAILSGTFNTELTDATGKKTNSTITFDSNTGLALVQLAHGESLKILNLPYNSVILVGEQKPVGYTMTISYDNGPESKVTSGTAIMNAAHTMKFINSRSFVPATGIISTIGIGLAILIPSGAGLAILAKKRKED